jgi:hypothetical protein
VFYLSLPPQSFAETVISSEDLSVRRYIAFQFFMLATFQIFMAESVVADTASVAETQQVYLPAPRVPKLSLDGKILLSGVPAKAVVVDPNPSAPRRRIPAPSRLASAPAAATAYFSIDYVPDGGSDAWKESCSSFPEDARSAFNAAVGIWANTVSSAVPITIRACWADLGSTNTLGYSGGGPVRRDFPGAPYANTWYAASLANSLHGADLDPDVFDMHITFNRNFAWYRGTDGNTPAGQYDLVSVVLHEIAHGLNFSGSMQYAGGIGSWGYGTGFPTIYDVFMHDGSGMRMIDTAVYPNSSPTLGSALISNDIWFHGSKAIMANSYQPVKMYIPGIWSNGSSYSHFDYDTFNDTSNQLMVYAISDGESIHDPGAITKGLFQDLGWTVSGSLPPSSSTYSASSVFPWLTLLLGDDGSTPP